MNKQKLIFIVDDDNFINNLVINSFSANGFKVIAFESGEDCLKAMINNPDLIILDYLFINNHDKKIMNGMEILDSIRVSFPAVPIIMLSAQEKGEIVLELAGKGIEEYLIKDNNLIENLKAAINEIFEKS